MLYCKTYCFTCGTWWKYVSLLYFNLVKDNKLHQISWSWLKCCRDTNLCSIIDHPGLRDFLISTPTNFWKFFFPSRIKARSKSRCHRSSKKYSKGRNKIFFLSPCFFLVPQVHYTTKSKKATQFISMRLDSLRMLIHFHLKVLHYYTWAAVHWCSRWTAKMNDTSKKVHPIGQDLLTCFFLLLQIFPTLHRIQQPGLLMTKRWAARP